MFKVTDFELTAKQILKVENEPVLAVGMSDLNEYLDGKKTEKVINKKVEIVLPYNKYEKITVKLPAVKHPLTPEMIEQSGGVVKVQFKGLSGRFYKTNSGDYALSCKAEEVSVIA